MVLRVLGALLCAMSISAGVIPKKDFTVEQMAGKWYMVGLATNAQWFVNHKSGMKQGTATVAPTAAGDLQVQYATLNSDGSCWRMTNQPKKTDTPGRFTFRNEQWNNDNDMRIVDVADFALVHTIKTKGGVTEVLNHLYSRTPEVSATVQQKFRQLALDTGILPENIAILPRNGECP